MNLADEKYLLFTTFRRSGAAVATAVWAVPVGGGSLGFWTSSGSGKAKRLANSDRALVQPCDSRGRVKAGSSAVECTARMATPAELTDIGTKITAKYGFMTKLTKVFALVGGLVKRKRVPYGDVGVVVTPAG